MKASLKNQPTQTATRTITIEHVSEFYPAYITRGV
jgi:hypothetical protein